MSPVSAIALMNLAGMSDDDLDLVRGVVARALAGDPDADEHGLLAAIEDEIEIREREQ